MTKIKSYIQDDVTIQGSGADRFIRFVESLGAFNGAFIQFQGSANKFHIGIHALNDQDPANDQKVLTIQRADGFIGINTETPNFELDLEGTFRNEGVRISPTFTDFTGRVALVNPSFGGSRLGDSDLQTPSLDVGTVINFIDGTTPQQVNFSIFENNKVITVRSAKEGDQSVGVFDFNGGNQAEFGVSDAEATFAATINFTDGKGYVNDVGVQRYEPGVSVVAKSFYDVMINSGGAPRMKHIKTYYDGTTYDVIREILVDGQMVHKKIVEFEKVTKGVDPVDDEDFVTKGYADSNYAGGGGGGTWKGAAVAKTITSGAAYTSMYSETIPMGTLANDGDVIEFEFYLAIDGAVGVTQSDLGYRLTVGGTSLTESGFPFASGGYTNTVRGKIVRQSSTTISLYMEIFLNSSIVKEFPFNQLERTVANLDNNDLSFDFLAIDAGGADSWTIYNGYLKQI